MILIHIIGWEYIIHNHFCRAVVNSFEKGIEIGFTKILHFFSFFLFKKCFSFQTMEKETFKYLYIVNLVSTYFNSEIKFCVFLTPFSYFAQRHICVIFSIIY